MVSLGNLIQRVQPSPTLAATARAAELKAQGRDIVSFTVGEPDFDTPQHVKDAATEALKKGYTKYTAVGGISPLKEAIAAKFKRDQNLDFKASEIIVTNGGKQSIAATAAVLLNPGDEAIIPVPYWTSYPDIVRLAGGEPVYVNTTAESGYLMTPEQLIRAVTPRTKMIFLNSPSNPTGGCYSESELKDLISAFKSLPNHKEIVILSDEIYEYITYDGTKHVSITALAPELRDNIVISSGYSKTYSMTGWRVGYGVGPKNIIDAVTTHQSQFTTNVCSIAQYAAAAAYSDNGAFPTMMRDEFAKRLDIVAEAVKQMPGITLPVRPKGAFYTFLRVEGLFGKNSSGATIRSGQDFANLLMEKYDVVVVQGEAFGDPGAIRLSFALSPEQLRKGLARIAEAASSCH